MADDTGRDTSYATEVARGVVKFKNGSEGRVERLRVKSRQETAIRFSWWRDHRMYTRPLDLTELELLFLFKEGIAESVFTTEFREKLRDILA